MRTFLLLATSSALVALAPTASAGEPAKVAWHDEWPRFSGWEGALTLAGTAGVFVAERRLADPPEARVTFEVPLLDPGVRWLLRGRTENVRDAFADYSDVGFRMMAFFPYVVDVGFASLLLHRNPDVAAQLFLIDAQALTLSGATQLFVSRLVGRQRPYVQDCESRDPTIDRCGTRNDFKSFYSGHSAGAFTTAGLVCNHHQHLPLFGGGPVEAWACTWALGAATLTGIARIVYDAHYASDVLVGAGIGWFYGYVMPKWMHFRDGGPMGRLGRWTPTLAPTGDGAVLSAVGTF